MLCGCIYLGRYTVIHKGILEVINLIYVRIKVYDGAQHRMVCVCMLYLLDCLPMVLLLLNTDCVCMCVYGIQSSRVLLIPLMPGFKENLCP